MNTSICKYLKLLWCVQHVLKCQVTAALQTAFTELTDELQVVQAVRYRHGLLHANILQKKSVDQDTRNTQMYVRSAKTPPNPGFKDT